MIEDEYERDGARLRLVHWRMVPVQAVADTEQALTIMLRRASMHAVSGSPGTQMPDRRPSESTSEPGRATTASDHSEAKPSGGRAYGAQTWRQRLPLAVVGVVAIVAALSVLVPARAHAAQSLSVVRVDVTDPPYVRIALDGLPDQSTLPPVIVRERGVVNDTVNVYPGAIGQRHASAGTTSLVIALDTSDSMHGVKWTNALTAVRRVLPQLAPGDTIGLVTFGSTVSTEVAPTTDRSAVATALAALQPSRGTLLYDGVRASIREFPAEAERRVVLVVSDGTDEGSQSTLAEVTSTIATGGVEVYAAGITGSGFSIRPLRQLVSAGQGTLTVVHDARDLPRLLNSVSRQILHGHWIEYRTATPPGTRVATRVTVAGVGSATTVVARPAGGREGRVRGAADPAGPTPVQVASPIVPVPEGTLFAVLSSAPFTLAALLVALVLRDGSRARRLERMVTGKGVRSTRPADWQDGPVHVIARTAAAAHVRMEPVASALLPTRRLDHLLEQANVPLRSVEFGYVTLAFAAAGAAIVLVLGPATAVAVGAMAGWVIPVAWLTLRARIRRSRFDAQIPGVLGSISASLKAGHGFTQALQSAAADAPDPIGSECRRAIAEARLGKPVEDALEAMGQRFDSAEFDFVVTSVSIQRQVGGSLSEILDMVAETIRGRQMFRRKVRSLTAMGRMSAYVLVAMPIVLAAIIMVVNPEFLRPLYSTSIGHMLIGFAIVSMALGGLACKRIVAVEA